MYGKYNLKVLLYVVQKQYIKYKLKLSCTAKTLERANPDKCWVMIEDMCGPKGTNIAALLQAIQISKNKTKGVGDIVRKHIESSCLAKWRKYLCHFMQRRACLWVHSISPCNFFSLISPCYSSMLVLQAISPLHFSTLFLHSIPPCYFFLSLRQQSGVEQVEAALVWDS